MNVENLTKFEPGKTYSMTSIGDHNCKWSFWVVRRTDKTVWLEGDTEGKGIISRRVEVWDGVETVAPFGRYSMSPILRASREVEAD